MKHLVIDIGNTRIKYALMESGEVSLSGSLAHTQAARLVKLSREDPALKRCILASVLPPDADLLRELQEHLDQLILLSGETPLPFSLLYRSPETLGPDRLAAVAGAHTKFPRTNVLVMDLGTAITIDLITAEGNYLGGNISPGMSMRFRAMHQFTGKLPLAVASPEAAPLGRDTGEALAAGVQEGIAHELNGYMLEYRSQYPDLKVILTGGDADFFVKKLKSPIFVDHNLIFTGLDRILRHNAEHAES